MTKLASLPARPRISALIPSYPRTVCLAIVAIGCGGTTASGDTVPATGGQAGLSGNIAPIFSTGGAPGTGGAAPIPQATGGDANFAGGVAMPFETGGASSGAGG